MKTTICVCPNHCGANLIAECSVRQEWAANSKGELVRELSSELDLDVLRLKCAKCGANAEDVDCLGLPVLSSSSAAPQKIGTLYLPEEEDDIAYYWANGESNVSPAEIHAARANEKGRYVYIGGKKYVIREDGVFPDVPIEGQVSLF